MRLKLAGLLFGAAALAGAAASAQPQGPAPGPRRPLNLKGNIWLACRFF